MKTKDERIIKKVYDQARDLLLSSGLSGWNMTTLAHSCGMTKRTLYKIVPSKEGLVGEILFAEMEEIQNELKKIMEEEGPYREILQRIATEFPVRIQTIQERPLRSVLTEYPTLEEKIIQRRLSLTRDLRRFLRDGQKIGEIHEFIDVDILLEILQGLTIFFTRRTDFQELRCNKLTLAIDYLLSGILVPREGD